MNEPKVKKNKSCFEGVLSVRNEQATNEKEAKRHKYCILKSTKVSDFTQFLDC